MNTIEILYLNESIEVAPQYTSAAKYVAEIAAIVLKRKELEKILEAKKVATATDKLVARVLCHDIDNLDKIISKRYEALPALHEQEITSLIDLF